jgi:hypothetical protein
MPPTAEQYQILIEHLGNRPVHCPICGTMAWSFEMLGCESEFIEYGAPQYQYHPPGAVMPLAILTCTNCLYVIQFSWLPMRQRVMAARAARAAGTAAAIPWGPYVK